MYSLYYSITIYTIFIILNYSISIILTITLLFYSSSFSHLLPTKNKIIINEHVICIYLSNRPIAIYSN